MPNDEEKLFDQKFEESIQKSAAKNNLTSMCVKRLLKKLVVNDHILAIVRLKEEEEAKKMNEVNGSPAQDGAEGGAEDDGDDKEEPQPKLTRLKAKELRQTVFPIASLNEPTPDEEIAALINAELSSDDDDEEYKPTEDEIVSDDDPNTTASDIDSQPRTPASTSLTVENDFQSEVQYTKDGLFKIPRARNDSQCSQSEQEQEQENIALRTRSKLCLTTTAIETLESTFIPPDITNDMYEYDGEMDQAWKDFLEEFTKPLLDPEEMRAGKVSKKELNALVLELMEMGATDDDQTLLEQTLTETINESLNCGQVDDRSSMINTPIPEENSERVDDSLRFAPIMQTSYSSQSQQLAAEPALPRVQPVPTSSAILSPLPSTSTQQDLNITMYPSFSVASQLSQSSNWSVLDEPAHPSGISTTTLEESDSRQSTDYGYWMPDCPRHPRFFMKYSSLEEASAESFTSTGNDTPNINTSESVKRYIIKATTVPVKVETTQTQSSFNDFQFQLLHQQLRMHVQLTTQHFLQTYAHPKHWQMARTYKDMLNELAEIGKAKPSVVPWNLPLAIDCCQSWEQELAVDNSSNKALIDFWCDEVVHAEESKKMHHRIYHGEFHWRVREKILNCRAFMYPALLPYKPFRCDDMTGVYKKTTAEERVLALWFERAETILNEEFKNATDRSITQKPNITTICEYIAKHWCSARKVSWLKHVAYKQKNGPKTPGKPIRALTFFFMNGYAPPSDHVLEVFDANNVIPLSQYDRGTLHYNWERYIFAPNRAAHLNLPAASTEQEKIVPNDSARTAQPEVRVNGLEVQFEIKVLLPEPPNTTGKSNKSYIPSQISENPETRVRNSVAVTEIDNVVVADAFDKSSVVSTASERSIKNTDKHVSIESAVIVGDKNVVPNGCTSSANYNEQDLLCVQNDGPEKTRSDTAQDVESQATVHLAQSISDSIVSDPKYAYSKGSVKNENRSRAAAVATLYAVLKKYVKALKIECRKELAHSLLVQTNHPIFRIYVHFKQLYVYCQFLNELRKMSDNFATYRHRYRPLEQCYSQRMQDGLLRLACSQCADGSLLVSAAYITDQFADYRSMEDKDAVFAFNFHEKVEETLLASGRTDLLERFEQILRNFDETEDRVSSLYCQVEHLLGESYPQLVDMFLTFLLPGQAAEVGKFFEHFILTNMGDFLEKLNIFFAKQPSQIKKIHACLTDLSNEPNVTMDQVKMKVLPLLKGSTLLTEWFLQLFPGERPPESSLGDYEHITMKKHALHENCDAGSVYEHISYIETTPEGPENTCGTSTIRYIQGRIFQGALPARLTFLAKNCVIKDTDQQAQSAVANGEVLCDDETFMAHAIRLNPLVHCPKGIRYADVAHLLEDNSNELELVSHPAASAASATTAEEEGKAATTSKKLTPKLPIKKRFSSPNTRKAGGSPGDEKNSPVGSKDTVASKKSVASAAVAVGPDSKALATARKLKTIIDGPQSSTQEVQQLDGAVCNQPCSSELLVPTHGLTKTTDKIDTQPDPEPLKEAPIAAQEAPSWTREEDKIILQDIIKGYSSVDAFVQQLEQKIPERSSEQIRSRFEFLHKMLRQVNQK
uniref:Myb-like domain-containing protein n=1 Tax=Anopheles dirus TaxID=7168 RepID=A0A182NSG0_9DIPT